MTKRTNRVAWGLAVVLAAVVLGVVGLLFTQGLSLGRVTIEARVRLPVRPFGPGGSEEGPLGGEGCWTITRSYNLRLLVLEISRTYYQQFPP